MDSIAVRVSGPVLAVPAKEIGWRRLHTMQNSPRVIQQMVFMHHDERSKDDMGSFASSPIWDKDQISGYCPAEIERRLAAQWLNERILQQPMKNALTLLMTTDSMNPARRSRDAVHVPDYPAKTCFISAKEAQVGLGRKQVYVTSAEEGALPTIQVVDADGSVAVSILRARGLVVRTHVRRSRSG